jgi:hypothetical protein
MDQGCRLPSPHPIKNRQPNGRFIWAGPLDPVLLMGGDADRISRLHFYHSVFKLELGGTGQDHDPFVLGLVIPEAFRRFVARRDDPFNPDAMALLKNRGEFFGQVRGEVGEEVHRVHVLFGPNLQPTFKGPGSPRSWGPSVKAENACSRNRHPQHTDCG